MNVRNLTNLILLLLLVALALVVYFEPGLESEPELQALTPLSTSDIHSMVLHRPGKPDVRLQRTEQAWFIASTPPLPAASAPIRGLLRLAQEKPLHAYTGKDLDPDKIGLVGERPEITFNDEYRIVFGATEPLDDQRYVRIGDRILLIQNFYQHLVEAGLDLWLDTRLLPAERPISRISLPGLTLQHTDQGRWETIPEQADMPTDALVQLVQSWQNSSALRVRQQASEARGEKISIQLDNPSQTIDFYREATPQETVFRRPDLGLEYVLSSDSAAALLQLSPQRPPAALPAPLAEEPLPATP